MFRLRVVPSSLSSTTRASCEKRFRAATRIAVGVDGFDEGRDAAVLGAAIARATGAELLLVAVHPDPLIVLPRELGWMGSRTHAQASLRETRDALAPGARIDVETDWSVARALERVVKREQRDLLVLGSSRRGPEGCVRIGKRSRQLLCHSTCALAVAPRGLSARTPRELTRLGVGYDGGAEPRAALAVAGSIARAAGAELLVRGGVDDRLPAVGWSHSARVRVEAMWDELLEPEFRSLREDAQRRRGDERRRRGRGRARSSGRQAGGARRQGRPAGDRVTPLGSYGTRAAGQYRRGAHARRPLPDHGRATPGDRELRTAGGFAWLTAAMVSCAAQVAQPRCGPESPCQSGCSPRSAACSRAFRTSSEIRWWRRIRVSVWRFGSTSTARSIFGS